MTRPGLLAGALLLSAIMAAPPASAQSVPGPMLVKAGGEWVEWLRGGDVVPARWDGAHPVLVDALVWRGIAPGVEHAELTIRRAGEPWRVRVVLARLDPARVALRLVVPPRRADGFAGRWSVEDAPAEALVALNAGHFTSGPWGWVVQGGKERQPAGTGRLAPGVALLESGRVVILPVDSLTHATGVVEGFQSYPTLLEGRGDVPPELRREGMGVDLRHRDGRLALGIDADGRVLLALTRLEGLGGLLEAAPFGPTTPEMSALMGALGCTRAVLLDGGLSGQLLLQRDGRRETWRGLRPVAAGLVVTARDAQVAP